MVANELLNWWVLVVVGLINATVNHVYGFLMRRLVYTVAGVIQKRTGKEFRKCLARELGSLLAQKHLVGI